MVIFEGIKVIYAHVIRFVESVSTWFTNIEWNTVIDIMPLQFRAPITALVVVLLAMSCIGICKKMSFLLG